MVNKIAQAGRTTYNLQEFIVDLEEEIEFLPKHIPMGSTAFVIENSKVYILNGKGEWKEV